MSWTLGGVIIHPPGGDYQGSVVPNYAIQQVLDATSETLNYFGASSDHLNLSFALIEDENSNTGKATLEVAARADADVVLVSDQGTEGNFRITNLAWTRMQDHSHTYPFYKCQAQMIKQ